MSCDAAKMALVAGGYISSHDRVSVDADGKVRVFMVGAGMPTATWHLVLKGDAVDGKLSRRVIHDIERYRFARSIRKQMERATADVATAYKTWGNRNLAAFAAIV